LAEHKAKMLGTIFSYSRAFIFIAKTVSFLPLLLPAAGCFFSRLHTHSDQH